MRDVSHSIVQFSASLRSCCNKSHEVVERSFDDAPQHLLEDEVNEVKKLRQTMQDATPLGQLSVGHCGRYADRRTDRQTGRDTQTDRQSTKKETTDKHADRQTDRGRLTNTGKETDVHINRETQAERHIQRTKNDFLNLILLLPLTNAAV